MESMRQGLIYTVCMYSYLGNRNVAGGNGFMATTQEDELIRAFRALEPKYRDLVLRTVKDQAEACLARRPKLRLVSSVSGHFPRSSQARAKGA